MADKALFDVAGQITLVTGAASGLGLAMADIMAESGAVVLLADVDAAGLQSAVHDLKKRGYDVSSSLVDISNTEQLHEAIDRCVREHGRLDVVFANAGISAGPSFVTSPRGQIDQLDMDLWSRSLEINLDGTFETMRWAAKYMKRQKSGRIIVTASIAGMRSSPLSGYGYIAAKAAVINLVHHAAIELAPYNVLVNAIAPGAFLTNIGGGGRRKLDEEGMQRITRRIPLGRLGNPEEVKALALFLASPGSGYITGAVIPIDGGTSAG